MPILTISEAWIGGVGQLAAICLFAVCLAISGGCWKRRWLLYGSATWALILGQTGVILLVRGLLVRLLEAMTKAFTGYADVPFIRLFISCSNYLGDLRHQDDISNVYASYLIVARVGSAFQVAANLLLLVVPIAWGARAYLRRTRVACRGASEPRLLAIEPPDATVKESHGNYASESGATLFQYARCGVICQLGWRVFKRNCGVLIPAGLLALLLSLVSGFLLAGPMLVGMMIIILRLFDGSNPCPQVADLFAGFSSFWPSFGLYALWFLLTQLAATPINVALYADAGTPIRLALSPLLLIAFLLMADRQLGRDWGLLHILKRVQSNGVQFVIVCMVAYGAGLVGLLFGGIGVLVSYPIALSILASFYRLVLARLPGGWENASRAPVGCEKASSAAEEAGKRQGMKETHTERHSPPP